MHRPTVGWISLVLFLAALVLRLWFPSDVTTADAFLRPAIVMGLLWLALPQLSQVPRWLMISAVVSAMIVMWRPRLLYAVVPIVAVLWFLRPRNVNRR